MNTRSATEGNSALETPKEAQSAGVPTKFTKRFRIKKMGFREMTEIFQLKKMMFLVNLFNE